MLFLSFRFLHAVPPLLALRRRTRSRGLGTPSSEHRRYFGAFYCHNDLEATRAEINQPAIRITDTYTTYTPSGATVRRTRNVAGDGGEEVGAARLASASQVKAHCRDVFAFCTGRAMIKDLGMLECDGATYGA